MLFSIVIPTYNRALILQETLLSVLSQSFDDYEIVVVDDGSTDNTKEVVSLLGSSKINYFYKLNEERSIARNFGAERALGQYLIFLDSDDKMKDDLLNSVREFIQKQDQRPAFIFTGYMILNPDHSVLYEYGISGFFESKKLFYGNYLGCSSVVVDKDLFKKYYFNTDQRLILFEDWELWLRISAENRLYCFPGKSIIMVNHGNRSVLNYNAAQITERILYFKNHVLKISKTLKSSHLYRRVFLMGIYSYAALHIGMTKKNRLIALKYFALAFFEQPGFNF